MKTKIIGKSQTFSVKYDSSKQTLGFCSSILDVVNAVKANMIKRNILNNWKVGNSRKGKMF